MKLGRFIRILVALLILGGAGWWVYNNFLAPAPDVAIRIEVTGSAQENILNGDLTEALADIQHGLEALPGDWELLAWESVLLDKLSESGSESLAQALEAGEPADVWIVRGMVALQVDEPEIALAAGNRIIELAPDKPQGYFLAAQSYENMGQVDEAVRYYQQTADLAQTDDAYSAIYVIARERIAALG